MGDVVIFFDAYDPHLNAKANLYHAIRSLYTAQIANGTVQFSYINRNNDNRADRVETHMPLRPDPNYMDVISKAPPEARANNPIPLYGSLQGQMGAWFQAGHGVRPFSTKICLAFIHSKAQTKEFMDVYPEASFQQLLKQMLTDYGIYLHFIIMPDEENGLKDMQ